MIKRISIIFLQTLIVMIGIATFIFLLWEPHLEGRNAQATLSEIYFNDPFLAWAYFASLFFFVALYQAFKLLGYVGRHELRSLNSLRAVRTIKICGIVLIGFIVVGEAYLFIMVRGKDDIAGGVAMGVLMAVISTIITGVAALCERYLQTRMS